MPKQFYIVTTWNDDFYPYWQATVTDVTQRADGVHLVYTYVQSATQPCNEPDVRFSEKLLPPKSLATLVSSVNLCALDPNALIVSSRAYEHRPGPFETVRRGIVAVCGNTAKVFKIPSFKLDMARLKQEAPQMYGLEHLEDQVLSVAFDNENLKKRLSPPEETWLQNLKSDKFRAGFWFCTRRAPEGKTSSLTGTLANRRSNKQCDWERFQSVLASYAHPPQGIHGRKGRLIDSSGYKLINLVEPDYGAVFIQGHITGTVKMLLEVNQLTGYVENVVVTSGPKYLSDVAADTARHWQFDPKQSIKNPVEVSVEFSVRCNGGSQQPTTQGVGSSPQ